MLRVNLTVSSPESIVEKIYTTKLLMSINVKTSLTSGGLASVAATLCCVMPFVLLMLGISGAWISYLVALEPYQPIFVAVALVALIFAYKGIFINNNLCTENDKFCAKPSVNRIYKTAFYIVAIMLVLSIVAPYAILYYN